LTLKKDKIGPAAAMKTALESCRKNKIDRSGVGNGPRKVREWPHMQAPDPKKF
jgi:hypothetical protein